MRTLDPTNVKYFKYAVGSNIGTDTPTDVQARCIICGDSERDPRQKRLHLYTKPMYDSDIVHCFNCGFKGNMYQFLKEVNTPLFEQYKKENREASFNNLKAKKEEQNAIVYLGNYEMPDVQGRTEEAEEHPTDQGTRSIEGKVIPDVIFELPSEFVRADTVREASDYLLNRRLKPKDYFFSRDKVFIDGKERPIPVADCVIIPLWASEEHNLVYGFQARSIKEKFFYTYIPPENSGWKVWNWFSIDRSKPTFIFESVFDAKSSGLPDDRISAALGADLIPEREAELDEAIYCFDNQHFDLTSKEKSIKLMMNGHRVFVWPTDIEEKDTNSWLQNHPDQQPQEMAKNILQNITTGMNGVMRVKLRK